MSFTSEDVFPLGGDLGGCQISFMFGSQSHLDYYAEIARREGLAAYEAPTPALISRLVQGGMGSVLDVGAHTGLLTLLAAASDAQTTVHAFEPLPSARQALEANVRLNPELASRVNIHAIALSDHDGEVTFYETINDMGFISTSSSIEIAHASSIDHGVFRERRVPTIRLDEWAAAHLGTERLKLIKIDVETHEYAVLAGGMKTILQRRPMIVAEVLPTAITEPHNALLAHGYLNFAIAPQALVQLPTVGYCHGAPNHLLCPSDRTHEVFGLCRQVGLRLEVG
ncbi:FkbM family methyltransferase [Rhodopila sp.]|uniref:FkbM family methyltransferase n=1 Tax=Rhodopila sp. TaxID=2480087 RepID=UPI003D095D8C